jgi:hypothetical protein
MTVESDKYVIANLRFLREFISTGDAKAAFKKANGPDLSDAACETGAQLVLNDPRIIPVLEAITTSAMNNLAIHKETVLSKLWTMAEDSEVNPLARIAALKLVGMERGMFAQKVNVEQSGKIEVQEVMYIEVKVKGKDEYNNSLPFRAESLPSSSVR